MAGLDVDGLIFGAIGDRSAGLDDLLDTFVAENHDPTADVVEIELVVDSDGGHAQDLQQTPDRNPKKDPVVDARRHNESLRKAWKSIGRVNPALDRSVHEGGVSVLSVMGPGSGVGLGSGGPWC